MPELPEVEVFRRYLSRHALKQTIEDVKVDCPELLEETSAWKLRKHLSGHQFQAARRHGKYLFAEMDNRTALVLHFGMTGELIYQGADDKAPDYSCLSLAFGGNNNLYYTSKRKLGLIAYTEDRRAYIKAKGLGPDASSLDADKFISALADASGAIKAALRGWVTNTRMNCCFRHTCIPLLIANHLMTRIFASFTRRWSRYSIVLSMSALIRNECRPISCYRTEIVMHAVHAAGLPSRRSSYRVAVLICVRNASPDHSVRSDYFNNKAGTFDRNQCLRLEYLVSLISV